MRREKMKTQEKNKKYFAFLITFVSVIIILDIPLSHAGIFGPSDREVLTKRAEKYWNSKLTGDMITCYQLEEPRYKKQVPVSLYVRTGSLMYKDVEIKDVQTDDDNGTVTVEIRYFIPALGSKHIFKTTVKDKWKKIQGAWYHVPEDNRQRARHKKTKKERR